MRHIFHIESLTDVDGQRQDIIRKGEDAVLHHHRHNEPCQGKCEFMPKGKPVKRDN